MIGDELGLGDPQCEAPLPRLLRVALLVLAHDQTLQRLRRMPPKPSRYARVEAHHCMAAFVGLQGITHPATAGFDIISAFRLDFDQERDRTRHLGKQFPKRDRRLFVFEITQRAPLVRSERFGLVGTPDQPGEVPVVKHHRIMVAAALDIALDSQPRFERCCESTTRILNPARTVQPAMGIAPLAQPPDPGRVGRANPDTIKP